MARLTREQIKNKGGFKFSTEEVELPEIGGSVEVRSLSVGQRDELGSRLPDDLSQWTIRHTAIMFAAVVSDPEFSAEEAEEFLADWPGEALDRVMRKFNEMIRDSEEDQREAATNFRGAGD